MEDFFVDFRNRVCRFVGGTISDSLVLVGTSMYFGSNSPHFYFVDMRESGWFLDFLKVQFKSELFKPEDFRDSVIEGIKRCGLAMSEQVTVRGRHPICVDSPAALAYVLQCRALESDHLARIRFCLGDDFEQFTLKAVGLIDNIMGQLRAL